MERIDDYHHLILTRFGGKNYWRSLQGERLVTMEEQQRVGCPPLLLLLLLLLQLLILVCCA